MTNKLSLEKLSKQATSILNIIGSVALVEFIHDTSELYDLLHMNEEEEQKFSDDNFGGDLTYSREVKLIRSIYILSKLIDKNHRTFKKIHSKHQGFWKLVEKKAEIDNST